MEMVQLKDIGTLLERLAAAVGDGGAFIRILSGSENSLVLSGSVSRGLTP